MQELARSRDGLEFFLTYADNAAVGYFEKQGFSTNVVQPRERVSILPSSEPADSRPGRRRLMRGRVWGCHKCCIVHLKDADSSPASASSCLSPPDA